mmetsp:Transcript_32082/g.41118  ORF Transcript_32082/g.41118 Transcript_32082/m.41118 type:complete len:81 (-) Transcript_32082:1112-1354(-)
MLKLFYTHQSYVEIFCWSSQYFVLFVGNYDENALEQVENQRLKRASTYKHICFLASFFLEDQIQASSVTRILRDQNLEQL